jgi:hypothetical protein
MLNERDALIAFWTDAKTAGVCGIDVDGAVLPYDLNTAWAYHDIINSHPSWRLALGATAYLLAHDGAAWALTDSEQATTYFTLNAISPYGTYTASAPNGEGDPTVAMLPAWYLQRRSGDEPQVVFRSHSVRYDLDALPERWRTFMVGVDVYHDNPDVALAIGTALTAYYAQYTGTTTSAAGYTFGGYRAQQMQAEHNGILEALPVKRGMLYRDECEITMINVSAVPVAS